MNDHRISKDVLPFQRRVADWMMETFSMEVTRDTRERNHRFLEEALELVQSFECTAAEAHMLVDYVYGRPVGEPEQEVGGVMVTLAALCNAHDIDSAELADRELARCWLNIERIRAKQAGKPRNSPLPGTAVETPACRSVETLRTSHVNEPGDYPVLPVLGTERQLTDAELAREIRWQSESSTYRALIELWERRGPEKPAGEQCEMDRWAASFSAPRTTGLAGQIDDAKRQINSWPNDVRVAMGLPVKTNEHMHTFVDLSPDAPCQFAGCGITRRELRASPPREGSL